MFFLILALSALITILTYRTLHQDWILYREAENQYNKKNFLRAIELYNKSLQMGLPSSRMGMNFANSYVALGDFNHAIALYRKYLDYHPKDMHARLELAKALSWVGNSKEAEIEYQKILEGK